MIALMAEHLARGISPLEVTYDMAHTFAWEFARQRSDVPPLCGT
jgi:hypothetical protein